MFKFFFFYFVLFFCLSKSIGMFGSKSAAIHAPFILLLLPITYYMFTWTTGTFRAPSKHLNLMESKDVCFFFPIFFSYLIHWCVCAWFFLKKKLEDGHSGEQFHGSYISPSMYEDEVVAKILKDLKGKRKKVFRFTFERLLTNG